MYTSIFRGSFEGPNQLISDFGWGARGGHPGSSNGSCIAHMILHQITVLMFLILYNVHVRAIYALYMYIQLILDISR